MEPAFKRVLIAIVVLWCNKFINNKTLRVFYIVVSDNPSPYNILPKGKTVKHNLGSVASDYLNCCKYRKDNKIGGPTQLGVMLVFLNI